MNYLEIFLGQFDSENTKSAYGVDLKQMLKFVGKDEGEIVQIDIVKWKNELKKFALSTQERRSRSMNQYINFLNNNGINTNLSTISGVNIDRTKQNRPALEFEQAKELLEVLDIRTKAIVSIFLSTGIRASEMADIELEDYLSGNDIVLYGKGSKRNVIRLSVYVRDLVDEYLTI